MGRNSITYNRADVKAAWQLLEKIGQKPTAVKFHPDGTFRIMTSDHVSKNGSTQDVPESPLDEWRQKNRED
jgi:hypothetical protein